MLGEPECSETRHNPNQLSLPNPKGRCVHPPNEQSISGTVHETRRAMGGLLGPYPCSRHHVVWRSPGVSAGVRARHSSPWKGFPLARRSGGTFWRHLAPSPHAHHCAHLRQLHPPSRSVSPPPVPFADRPYRIRRLHACISVSIAKTGREVGVAGPDACHRSFCGHWGQRRKLWFSGHHTPTPPSPQGFTGQMSPLAIPRLHAALECSALRPKAATAKTPCGKCECSNNCPSFHPWHLPRHRSLCCASPVPPRCCSVIQCGLQPADRLGILSPTPTHPPTHPRPLPPFFLTCVQVF